MPKLNKLLVKNPKAERDPSSDVESLGGSGVEAEQTELDFDEKV